MPELERRAKIQRLDLLSHGFRYFRVAVPQTRCPQTGVTIENPSALIIRKPHILCRYDNAGVTLELSVASVRHPIGVEGEML